MCLGNILNEVSVNGKLYPLSNLDMGLLDAAAKIFIRISEEVAASPLGQEINNLMNQNEDGWDEWFDRYKVAAGKQNPVLAPDENGFSLIDIMDDEPTKRAFRDGVNPENLGKMFAKQFDIAKMGFK